MPDINRVNDVLKSMGKAPISGINPRTAQVLQSMNKEPPKIFSGNLLSDVADALSIPSYATAGLLQGKGIVKGVKERANWTDWLRTNYPETNEPFFQKGNFRLTPANVFGTIGDIALDPTWIVPPAKVGGMIGKAAKAAGVTEKIAKAAEASKLVGGLEKFTVPALDMGLKPSTRAALKTLGEIEDKAVIQHANLLEPAMQAARKIAGLSPEAQDLISQYIEAGGAAERAAQIGKAQEFLKTIPESTKGLTEAAKSEIAGAKKLAAQELPTVTRESVLDLAKQKGLNPELIKQLGEEAIKQDEKIGRAMVDAGVMSEETFNQWKGQHLRRVYQKYEDTQKFIDELRKSDPAAASELDSTLKNMGTTAAGSKISEMKPKIPLGATAERKDLSLAERQALGEVTGAGYRLGKGAQMGALAASKSNMLKDITEHFASDAFKPGYLRMPEGAAWGELSGKWVPDFVHSKLLASARVPGGLEKLSQKAWGAWKMGKTIWNPATWARNIVSNFLLADNAGLSPARLDIYGEALADLVKNGKWINEAKQAGTAFTDTFAGRELPQFLDGLQKTPGNLWEKLGGAMHKANVKMGDAYQFQEQLGKLAIYIFKRKQGIAPEAAAKAAEEWLFNYRKVPQWMSSLRAGRYGLFTVPFITFPYKAIPAYAKALYNNPARVARWFKYGQGVERSVVAQPGELQREAKVQPDWMKQGFYLRIPAKDEYGRSLYLDLNYLLPFADVFNVSGIFTTGGSPGFASMPLNDAIQDLVRNNSRFTGRPIWKDGATAGQKQEAVAKYVKDFMLPPLLFGYSYDKAKDSIMKVPDWRGRTSRLDVTLANVIFGLKERPIDADEETVNRLNEIQTQLRALESNLRSVATDPRMSQKDKNKVWDQGLQQMDQLIQEAAQYGAGK